MLQRHTSPLFIGVDANRTRFLPMVDKREINKTKKAYPLGRLEGQYVILNYPDIIICQRLFFALVVVAIAAFLAAMFIGKTPARSFWQGFAAVFIGWAVLALFKSTPNDHILAGRVVQLFPIPHHWILLLLITAIIGGLVGGMASLSGIYVKKLFEK